MNKIPKIYLIHTPCLDLNNDRLEAPLGLLYLATVIHKQGFLVQILDFSGMELDAILTLLPDDGDVFGFSTYTANYHITLKLLNKIKRKSSKAIMLAGGPHATALPNDVLKDGFDFVIRGEAELSILYLLSDFPEFKQTPRIIEGLPIRNLDDLSFPNYDLVDIYSYNRKVAGEKSLSILTSRGCPYQCAFCNSSIMGAGKPIRFRSPENIVDEIRRIKSKYKINYFRFQDDIFNYDVHRLEKITVLLKQENIKYRCFARVNNFSLDIAKKLQESGCMHVSFGVESGSQEILGVNAMNKGQTLSQIEQALNNASQAGLRIRIFLMVGFPGETEATITETIAFIKRCPFDEFSVYPVIPYPGTRLYQQPEDYGIISIEKDYAKYFQIGKNLKAGFVIKTNTFDETQVRIWRDKIIQALILDHRQWAGHSKDYL